MDAPFDLAGLVFAAVGFAFTVTGFAFAVAGFAFAAAGLDFAAAGLGEAGDFAVLPAGFTLMAPRFADVFGPGSVSTSVWASGAGSASAACGDFEAVLRRLGAAGSIASAAGSAAGAAGSAASAPDAGTTTL